MQKLNPLGTLDNEIRTNTIFTAYFHLRVNKATSQYIRLMSFPMQLFLNTRRCNSLIGRLKKDYYTTHNTKFPASSGVRDSQTDIVSRLIDKKVNNFFFIYSALESTILKLRIPYTGENSWPGERLLESSWNVMAHGDARDGKWRRNWRMEWVASTLHITTQHCVSSITTITTADGHTSAASSRLNWRPRRFKWTRPFRRKTKSGFCTCAITFQTQSTFPRRTSLRMVSDNSYIL
jgi:hypothetical protein